MENQLKMKKVMQKLQKEKFNLQKMGKYVDIINKKYYNEYTNIR